MAKRKSVPDAESESSYEYTAIKDLRVDREYNIYGVVKSFKPHKLTKSGWNLMSFWLVDESCIDAAGRTSSILLCALFESENVKLPVINIGDIVRLHRLKINVYGGNLQGKAAKGFSWLVAHGNQVSHSHDHVTYTSDDEKRIYELIAWKQTLLDYRYASRIIRLADIECKDIWINLSVQVVSVFESNTDLSCTMIVAWDSTLPPFMSFCYCLTDNRIGESNEKLQRVSRGRTVKLFCYDNHHIDASKLTPGQIIKAVNLHVKVIDKTAINTAYSMGFLSKEDLDCSKPWLALVMHGGTHNGRRISVLHESEDEYKELNSIISKYSESEEIQSALQAGDIIDT